MSARWSDPQPPTPSRAIGISIGVVAILVLTIIAILAVTTDRAGANNYPTTTGATTTEPEVTTIPTAVPEVTTTVQQATTTAGLTCGLCAGQFSPTTTVPVTTTVASPTTTEAPTTTVGEGTAAQEPEVIPPVVETPAAPVPVADELPVTGASSGLIAVGLAVLVLGVFFVLGALWRRSA